MMKNSKIITILKYHIFKVVYDRMPPLEWATQHGWLDVVKYLVEEKGVDINYNFGFVFVTACEFNRVDIARYLIEKGIKCYPGIEKLGLSYAHDLGHKDMIKFLIEEVNIESTK